MQPLLIVTSKVPGLVYLGGRFAGETSSTHPLILPVSPFGAQYLDYHPLDALYLPSTHRLTFSDSTLLPESIQSDASAAAVLWPANQTELEILPRHIPSVPLTIYQDHIRLTLFEDWLLIEHNEHTTRCQIPPQAGLPEVLHCGDLLCLSGEAYDQRYALFLNPEDLTLQLSLTANLIRLEESGLAEVLLHTDDLTGHARLETWQCSPASCRMLHAEPVWAGGSAHWPQTPEETALAALQAAQLGLTDEVSGYLLPTSDCAEALHRAAASRGAVPMAYPAPGALPCVGLLQSAAERVLQVTPIFFRAEYSPGLQGPWRLSALSLDPIS